MNIRILIIFCLTLQSILAFGKLELTDYWLVDQYFSEFPAQQEKFESFNLLVQKHKPTPVSNSKKVSISVVYPGIQASDYWRRSIDSFTKRLDELEVNYEIDSHFTKPGVEILKQSQLLRESLKSNPDYLIFTLDALKHKQLIESIIATNRTKVILQNITTPLRAFGSRQPFLYVGFDHSIGSTMLAKQFVKQLGSTGNYAVLYGTKGYVSSVRGGTLIDYMTQNTDFNMVASYFVKTDRILAQNATRDLLDEFSDLKFIYACTTDVALGVVDVLKERDLIGKIAVNGWGGGSAELEAIAKKQINFTVMRMNDDNGVAMAEAIGLDLMNQAQKVPTIYSGDFSLVDKDLNVKRVEQLKAWAFRYSK